MRRLILGLVAVAALATSVTTAPASRVQDDPCPSTFAPGFEEWRYPSVVAWGRTATLEAKAHVFTWWEQRHVAVGVGDQEPSEHSGLGLKYDGLFLNMPVKMPRGRSGVRLRFRWTLVDTDTFNPSPPCEQTKELAVRGGPGTTRGFRERLHMGFPLNSSVYWEPAGKALHGPSCASFAALPATLTVTSGRFTRTVSVRDQCEFNLDGGKNHVTRKADVWDVSAYSSARFNGGFWLSYWGIAQGSLRYRLTVGTAVVRSGTIIAHPHYKADRVIWEGTDDFVNVCINHLLQIRSKGGRLYCVAPGSYSVTFTRKP